jgi:putative Mg2+ transporter-C (MgtC) family protein
MLVCIGAAAMMIISEGMYEKYSALSLTADSFVRVDPGRIAAQIITGIGFIGAGVIMKMGLRVQGLTTAACLWLAAGVGMAAGTGMHLLAFVSTITAGVVLFYLGKLEKRMERDIHRTLTVWTSGNRAALEVIRPLLKGLDVTLSRYTYEDRIEKGIVIYTLDVKMRKPDLLMLASQAIREKVEKVTRIVWD